MGIHFHGLSKNHFQGYVNLWFMIISIQCSIINCTSMNILFHRSTQKWNPQNWFSTNINENTVLFKKKGVLVENDTEGFWGFFYKEAIHLMHGYIMHLIHKLLTNNWYCTRNNFFICMEKSKRTPEQAHLSIMFPLFN